MFESMGAPDLVEVLLEEERRQAVSQARQLRITAELSRRSPERLGMPGGPVSPVEAVEVTAAEIGPALSISRFAALARVQLALTAEQRLPGCLEALAAGRLTLTPTPAARPARRTVARGGAPPRPPCTSPWPGPPSPASTTTPPT